MAQQGDVILFQTVDGGEIRYTDGLAQMDGGLQTYAYLSLFGGNFDDNGIADNKSTWWGNLGEDEEMQYRSETQNLLEGIPAIPANLRRIEDAATRDLSGFITNAIASSVSVEATIPGINRIKLSIDIDADSEKTNIVFELNWKASI